MYSELVIVLRDLLEQQVCRQWVLVFSPCGDKCTLNARSVLRKTRKHAGLERAGTVRGRGITCRVFIIMFAHAWAVLQFVWEPQDPSCLSLFLLSCTPKVSSVWLINFMIHHAARYTWLEASSIHVGFHP